MRGGECREAPWGLGGREKQTGSVPARARHCLLVSQDCFFASVAEVSNPEFKGKPLVSVLLFLGVL